MTINSEKNILVVEDNDFVRMQIIRYLNDSGFATREARDGNEALETMGAETSLAIVDMRMEPMGGLDFVKSLRGRNIQTPVVFITGDHSGDILEHAAKWNVVAVLIKPVLKDRLVQAVQRALTARRSE